MDAKRVILTRGLPKTGQYRGIYGYDDGNIQAGWWVGLGVATNRCRFIAQTISDDKIVRDRATGLMWAADGAEDGGNGGAVITPEYADLYAAGLTFAGFTDWRVPNILELMSIVNYGGTIPFTYGSYFKNIETAAYWSSTISPYNPAHMLKVTFEKATVAGALLTDTNYILLVRGGV